MKKHFLLFLFIICLSSCQDYLETDFDGSVDDEMVWSNPKYAEGVLLNAYHALPNSFALEDHIFMDCMTDNAVTNDYSSSIFINGNGAWRAENNILGDWNKYYAQLENINLWLKYGQTAPYYLSDKGLNTQIVMRLKGEAYFLRAWYTWQLLQAYGGKVDGVLMGIPLQTKALENNTDKYEAIERDTYEDCISQIVSDCNKAIELLPPTYEGTDLVFGEDQTGRANLTAAFALKSRVLLYAASPLFEKESWSAAARAALDAINQKGESLPGIKWGNLDKYYNSQNHNEIILRKFTRNNSFFRANFPPSSNGSGRTSPSQNLAKSFYMANGYPQDHELSGFDPNKPFEGLSKRYYASIVHNGMKFKNKSIETYEGGFDTEQTFVHATRTGHYLRKWMAESASTDGLDESVATHYYALFRQAELWLNFAEAANEWVGPDVKLGFGGVTLSAKDAILEIRNRAGIKDTAYLDEVAAQGKDAFRELIRNERRVELCFEGHRFWDLRRWKSDLNSEVNGLQITMNADSSFSYQEVLVEQRNFQDYMYFGPIPFDEVRKGLRQNDGW
ncbi:RagB/SusD family nutrient uptake outer membrane protein [Sediminitomix flava]|nr:RagB/SusD family nutrient uptake outer membrane protein [Sediminitomix flava]